MDSEPDPPKRMATQGNRFILLNIIRKTILPFCVRKNKMLV